MTNLGGSEVKSGDHGPTVQFLWHHWSLVLIFEDEMKYGSSNYQLIWTSQFWSNIIRPLPVQLRGGSHFPFVHTVVIRVSAEHYKSCVFRVQFHLPILLSMASTVEYAIISSWVQSGISTARLSYKENKLFYLCQKRTSLSLYWWKYMSLDVLGCYCSLLGVLIIMRIITIVVHLK